MHAYPKDIIHDSDDICMKNKLVKIEKKWQRPSCEKRTYRKSPWKREAQCILENSKKAFVAE